jgi:hypothetical protein
VKRALAIAWILAGCAANPSSETRDARSLAAQLNGEFSNAAQMATLPATVSRTPARSGEWLDAQNARFLPFSHARLGPHAVFFEWRSPDANGSVTRRRIWAFQDTPDGVAMRFFSFKDESAFDERSNWETALAALDPSTLVSYPDGCTVRFSPTATGWLGRLDGSRCQITAQRSGKTLALDATIELTASGMSYREEGRYADGEVAFVVPGFDAYRFEQIRL